MVQFFAFDKRKCLISADRAKRKEDYFCRECGSVMRLRGGVHRTNHFFHLKPTFLCRQSQKSLVHIQVQHYLQKSFPEGNCELEKQFPEISRIADVVWESRKVVFEVQCSPISKEEVEKRNQDYASLGYQVVWILHERRFNQKRLCAAEIFLRNSPYYFTNIDSAGNGEIYDQIDVYHVGFRRSFLKIVGLKVQDLKILGEEIVEGDIPKGLQSRLQTWPLHFAGDLLDCWFQKDEETLISLKKALRYEGSFYQKAANPICGYLKEFIQRVFIRPYKSIFQLFLEKSCR